MNICLLLLFKARSKRPSHPGVHEKLTPGCLFQDLKLAIGTRGRKCKLKQDLYWSQKSPICWQNESTTHERAEMFREVNIPGGELFGSGVIVLRSLYTSVHLVANLFAGLFL